MALVTALLGLSLAVSSSVAPAEDAAGLKRRVFIMTRALTYDARLALKPSDDYMLVVVGKKGNAASEKMAEEATLAFKPLEAVKIAGRPFRVMAVPFAGVGPLEALIDKEGVDALFICDGLAAEIPTIKELSRRKKVLTLGVLIEQVQAGISLAVVLENGRLQVVVNLAESKEEGASFGSDLLRVARVVK
jgi:hypothetical protein